MERGYLWIKSTISFVICFMGYIVGAKKFECDKPLLFFMRYSNLVLNSHLKAEDSNVRTKHQYGFAHAIRPPGHQCGDHLRT